ncbi:MAG TPA: hypothetical protein VMK82_01260 [Steroidobacteraceae bacterium]|nr:hypothetical protein [Steroidobacteraceae bacterium]
MPHLHPPPLQRKDLLPGRIIRGKVRRLTPLPGSVRAANGAGVAGVDMAVAPQEVPAAAVSAAAAAQVPDTVQFQMSYLLLREKPTPHRNWIRFLLPSRFAAARSHPTAPCSAAST